MTKSLILSKSSILISTFVAIKPVPAFPGKQYNFLIFFDSNSLDLLYKYII